MVRGKKDMSAGLYLEVIGDELSTSEKSIPVYACAILVNKDFPKAA